VPSSLRSPRIAVLPPDLRPWAADAVKSGGGTVVQPADAEALVWTATGFEPGYRPADLVAVLADHPGIRWVQLPWAGVEPYAAAGAFDEDHAWTSGKGVYARPVAEHALALALAGVHHLKAYSEARSWTAQAGGNLVGARVTIFGGGGITEQLLELLEPFRGQVTVVRKHPEPMAGADQVVGWVDRDVAVMGADVVFLALALTPETEGFVGRRQFEAMSDKGWLVNVARGRHVITDDLADALRAGVIAGAALDVTEPEPLPDGHPLWDLPTCLVTPHTANTYEMAIPLLTARITDNVRRYAAGEDLLGRVNPALGY
jgi:phosphoglycerate dehydrogenase-like enzyme